MNRRLNVLATRRRRAVAASAALSAAPSSRATPAPTVVVPGPDDRRDRIAPRHGRHDGHASPPRPRTATDASYTFTSADPAVATVDGTGLVTGLAVGETAVTITGDDDGDGRAPDRRRRRARDADPLLRDVD